MKLLSVLKFIGSAAAIFIATYVVVLLLACVIIWPDQLTPYGAAQTVGSILAVVSTMFGMFYIYNSEE